MELATATAFPACLADIGPRDIRRAFDTPTLLSIAGEIAEPLCVTVLLHGNETTSFFVLQHLARRYADTAPPRSLMIFVANVKAAEAGQRYLEGQPDFNRIWEGGDSAYHRLVQDVLDRARAADIFASIDIHNNSGDNPHYGCVNALRPADLHLAAMFSDISVYYRNPSTTQSIAFSRFCPAVTIECGQSGDDDGVARAIQFVEAAMRLEHFPEKIEDRPARLYETIGAVVVAPEASVSFGQPGADLVFRADLEALNFADLPAGADWAQTGEAGDTLKVIDEHGHDLTARFFAFESGTLRLKRAVTPAMITHDERIIRQDCLCYLMRKI